MAGFVFQQNTQNPGPDPAVLGAYQMAQGAINNGLATIQPGRFVGSSFGQGLMSRFAGNAPGISPDVLAAQRRQVSRQAAQTESGNLQALRQSAASGGFNFSRGLGKAETDVRAQSADTVQQSMDRFLIASEEQKRQQEGESLAALMQLYGIEGGLAAQYANIQAQRQFPVIPGVTPPGTMPGGGYGGGSYGSAYGAGGGGSYTGACPPGYIPGAGGVGCVPDGSGAGGPPPLFPPGYDPRHGTPTGYGGYQSPSGGYIVPGSAPTPGSILMRMYGQ